MTIISIILALSASLSAPLSTAPDHSAWDELLQKHVSEDGAVDYKGFKKDRKALQAYLDKLAARHPMDSWSRDEKLVYWVNAYNAFTVKLILDHYPVKSIKDIHNGNPWDVKWIELGKRTYSLNQIEHDVIRPHYAEPRIHFAVNCAAKSCPPLLNRAFTVEHLEAYLEQQTKSFINNEAYNKVQPNALKLSQIFNWYGEDFGDVAAYVDQYTPTSVKPGAKITFMDYNWALND